MSRLTLQLAASLALAAATPALAVDETYRTDGPSITVQTIADGLDHPWALAFLPEDGMLVTERPVRCVMLHSRARSRSRSEASRKSTRAARAGCSTWSSIRISRKTG